MPELFENKQEILRLLNKGLHVADKVECPYGGLSALSVEFRTADNTQYGYVKPCNEVKHDKQIRLCIQLMAITISQSVLGNLPMRCHGL